MSIVCLDALAGIVPPKALEQCPPASQGCTTRSLDWFAEFGILGKRGGRSQDAHVKDRHSNVTSERIVNKGEHVITREVQCLEHGEQY